MPAEVTLGAIVRAKGAELMATRPTTAPQRKVMRAIAGCRTASLGGHRDQCDRCGFEHTFWNSCRNRHCPLCGAEARERWLERRRDEILDVPYFHAVFTIPEILRPVAFASQQIVYAILMRAAAQALLDVGATRLRARLGLLAVLHTWGQTLVFHPHVHCVVPGGGISLDGSRWVGLRKTSFLLWVKALSRRFRTLFCNGLRGAFTAGTLALPPAIARDLTALDLLLARASRTDWHVHLKPPFGGPSQVLAYLASYTHRIAISNRRILGFDGRRVTFAWRDYAADNAHKTMTLEATEFLRRFLLHVVPRRFTRIRYYGFLGNRQRAANIARARRLIGSRRPLRARPTVLNTRLCPQCRKGTMHAIARIVPQLPPIWFDSS